MSTQSSSLEIHERCPSPSPEAIQIRSNVISPATIPSTNTSVSPAHIDHDEQMEHALPLQRTRSRLERSPEQQQQQQQLEDERKLDMRDISLRSPVPFSPSAYEPANEPEWAWNLASCKLYCSYWFRAAKVYTLDRLSPTRIRKDWTREHSHILLQVIYTAITFLFFFLMYYFHAFAAHVPGYGQPQDITCHSIGWANCGINGGDCQPFESSEWTAFRCPNRCKLLGTDGNVIGGTADAIYKADSHICEAALHAGITSDATGGCFLYRPSGVQDFFPGSSRNGIDALEFSSWFPGSFQLVSVDSRYCSNFGVAIILVAIFWFIPLALMKPNAMLLWYIMLFWGYWYITFTLNDHDTPINLFWNGTLNSFILAVFGYVLYYLAPQYTLYVDEGYEDRSKDELPWRYCCRRRRRKVHSRGNKRQQQPFEVVNTNEPNREHSSTTSMPPRLSIPSSNQVIDSFNILIPSTSSNSSSSNTATEATTTTTLATQADPMPVTGSTSPLGSQHAAIQAQHISLAAPLIPASLLASPSPSPDVSPPATSALYYPPDANHGGGGGEMRRRVASTSPEQPLNSPIQLVPIAPSTAPSSKLILRPWYDLYFLYILPLLAAVHWSYLVYVPVWSDVDLNSKFFSHGAGGIVLVLIIILILLAVILYHIKLAFHINILFRYLFYYFLIICGIIFLSLLFPAGATFHLHHVLAGILLIPISRFNTRVSLVFQAIVTGIFLNGLGLWNLTVDWDLSGSASPYTSNPFNVAPITFQLQNATASTCLIGWPVYLNNSDAIGTTLFLNDIEILHSPYVDTTYGGGITPYNSTTKVTLSTEVLMNRIRVTDPTSHKRPHRGLSARMKPVTPLVTSIRLPLPSRPPQLRLPHRSTTSTRATTPSIRTLTEYEALLHSAHPPLPSTRLFSTHTTEKKSLSHSFSTLPSKRTSFSDTSNTTVLFYVFELVNLLPNTTYIAQAGYLLPNNFYNMGEPLIFQTNDSPP